MTPQDRSLTDTRNRPAAPAHEQAGGPPVQGTAPAPPRKKSHRGTVILAALLVGALGLSALAAGAALLAVGIGAVAAAGIAIYLVWTTRRGG